MSKFLCLGLIDRRYTTAELPTSRILHPGCGFLAGSLLCTRKGVAAKEGTTKELEANKTTASGNDSELTERIV